MRTIKAIDGSDIIYKADHLRDFFLNEVYNNLLALSQDEKDRWFRMHTDHEDLIAKIFGENVLDVMGPCYLLAKAARENLPETADDVLLIQYKEWAARQT